MRIALWPAAGFLLGMAFLAGGQSDERLREKLIELEELSARLRALGAENPALPPVAENGYELDFVPLSDVARKSPDWQRPHHSLQGPQADTGCSEQEETIEPLMEFVRSNVDPAAWEEGASLQPVGDSLLVFATPRVLRNVRAFVDRELRPMARRSVALDLEIVEAEGTAASALAAAAGGALDVAAHTALDEAIRAGKARRVFAGRMRALLGQQVVFWHGAEIAEVADVDVQATAGATFSDPVVTTDIEGTIVEARVSGGDSKRLRLELDLESGKGDRPPRTVKTAGAGTVQMPARGTMEATADLLVVGGTWTVAAERSCAGARRFVLVRATPVGGVR